MLPHLKGSLEKIGICTTLKQLLLQPADQIPWHGALWYTAEYWGKDRATQARAACTILRLGLGTMREECRHYEGTAAGAALELWQTSCLVISQLRRVRAEALAWVTCHVRLNLGSPLPKCLRKQSNGQEQTP